MCGQHGRNYGHGGYRGGGCGRGYGRGRRGRNNNQSIDDLNCILPLKPTLTNEQINKIKVKCRHRNNNNREAMIVLVAFDCPVPYNKKLLIRAHHDFVNNACNKSLHCNNEE